MARLGPDRTSRVSGVGLTSAGRINCPGLPGPPAVTHNDAPRVHPSGSLRAPNRRSVWPLESRIGHAGADRDAEASGSGLSQGRQTLASRKLHTQPTDGQRSKPWS